jgi:gluconate 2-dehydrogenase gamma chain
MAGLDRRSMLQLLASAPLAAGFAWTEAEASTAHALAQAAQTANAGAAFTPKFFTAHEYATVRLLVDIILPRDERSGSATDAGVPEFMDFMMIDQPTRQLAMRGGLAWLDLESQKRYDKRFIDCADGERTGLLDDIAARPARPELSHGAAFFTSFRDLTATGFWTSKLGMDDLQFMGNRYVATWNGCPDAALKKLGVSYPPA